MSNGTGRRIKRRHAQEREDEFRALFNERVEQVLELAREQGCTCSPCVFPPEPPPEGNGRWQLSHEHGCGVEGLKHDHEAECPECRREREEAEHG